MIKKNNCKKCKTEYFIPEYWLDEELKKLIEEGYCPPCAYWELHLRKYGDKHPSEGNIFWVSIDGKLYLFNKREALITSIRGVNLEWQLVKPIYYILMYQDYSSMSGNRRFKTNNLIEIGQIPEEYRDYFPTNAQFITREQYYTTGGDTLEN